MRSQIKNLLAIPAHGYAWGSEMNLRFSEICRRPYFSGLIWVISGHLIRDFVPGGVDTYDRRNTYKTPYWTPSNPINDFPSLTNTIAVYGGGISFYKPASFVRIQDLTLSYSLPGEWTDRLMAQNIRFYGSVRNLYSFDKWPGWDPETLTDPLPRTISFGVDVTLK